MIERLEARMREQFGSRHAFVVGRGSTAIALALSAIRQRSGEGGEVLVPSIGCAAIAQLVYYAGFTPRWVDLNLDDYTMDPAALEAAITPRSRAIIAVHLFGHACDMDAIMAIAARHGLPVIEDAAQSLGGSFKGRALGSIGDFGVFSFAGEKIINAGAGGAITTNSDDWAALVSESVKALPPYHRSPGFSLRSLSHRNLYHGVVDLLRADSSLSLEQVFRTAMPHYRDLYEEQFPDDAAIAEKLESQLGTLPAMVAKRIERAGCYDELLARLPVRRSSNWRSSRTLWRYTFLLENPETALRVTAALRKNKIHASNHYWSLADIFDGDKSLPNTAYFCPRVLNLWVDDVANEAYIRRSVEIIEAAL